jgi:acetyl-CoA carboxylase carboxyltransferase component
MNAAANGCVDNVVEASAVRAALIDSVEIMAGKRVTNLPKKHSNIQL